MNKAKHLILSLEDRPRLVVKYLVDVLFWVAMTPLAFLIRLELEGNWSEHEMSLLVLCLVGLLIKGAIVYGLGFHRHSWHRVGVIDLKTLVKGTLIWTVPLTVFAFLPWEAFPIPRSVPLIEGMLTDVIQGAGAELMPENILDKFFGAFIRQQLVVLHIHQQALYVWPVLHIMLDAWRKISFIDIAARTALDFYLVFCDDQLQRG